MGVSEGPNGRAAAQVEGLSLCWPLWGVGGKAWAPAGGGRLKDEEKTATETPQIRKKSCLRRNSFDSQSLVIQVGRKQVPQEAAAAASGCLHQLSRS